MDTSTENTSDTPIDNVISLADRREEARKNKEKEELKKLPQTVADYLDMRNTQIKTIQDSRALIKEFEEKRLCLSKQSQLTGPQIDMYLSYKVGIMIALDNLKYNDDRVKSIYPTANLPAFE